MATADNIRNRLIDKLLSTRNEKFLLAFALCTALIPCIAQDNPHGNHDMHQPQADSVKNYFIMKSWDHWREMYIAKGNSEAEAYSAMVENLAWFAAMDRTVGDDLIEVEAPPFRFDGWLNSKPLTLEDLKGNVVLVRWFTDTCPFCASSTPALRQLYDEYTDKGLKMIGVFHPKAGRDDP